MQRYLILAVSAVLWTAGDLAAQELVWKLNKGDRFFVHTAAKTRQSMKFMGQEVPQEFAQKTVTRVDVKEKSPETIVIAYTTEKMEIDAGAGLDPKLFKALEGLTVSVHLDPKTFKARKVEGYKELVEKAAGNDPLLQNVLRVVLTEDFFMSNVESQFGFLPAAPGTVSKGQRWQQTGSIPMGPLGKLEVTKEFTYEGPVDKDGKTLDKISYKITNSKFTLPANKQGFAPGVEFSKADLKVTSGSGVYYFDRAAGRLLSSDDKVVMSGQMEIEAMGNKVVLEIKNETEASTTVKDTK
ncbi:MAG: hypothetical protein C4297_06510 [Gemmataceae bacterium]